MENTNDNLAAVSLHESAHPRDEQSFKQLQGLALIKGIVLVCGKKYTTNEIYEVVHMSLCTPLDAQYIIVNAESIWRAIILNEVLYFDDLMNLARNYSMKDDCILKCIIAYFNKRYPTEELVKDYILRTDGDITCVFYAKNLGTIRMNQEEFAAHLESKTQDRDFSDWRLFSLLDRLSTQLLKSVFAYVSRIEITDLSVDLRHETLCVFDEIRDFPENASNDVKKVIEKLYALRYCIQDMIISRNGRV